MSITTDLGTERGLADFETATAHCNLADYIVASAFDDDDDGDGEQRVMPETRHLFADCLTVAGLLHIFSNASKDVYKIITSWGTFYESLKILEPLLTHRDRLDRYVHLCVEGSAAARPLADNDQAHRNVQTETTKKKNQITKTQK